MTATFWSNTIWYILLGLTTVIELVIFLCKAKDRKGTFALYLIIAGITYVMEATIYCFLQAYEYHPMLVPKSPMDDGLAGNLFSQFSVSATALLIAVLKLKNYWFFIFSVIYGLIEELFLSLGIYRHNWYQTWMTMVGVLFIFWIAKKLYHSGFIYGSRIRRYLFMSFGLYTLHMPTIFWVLVLTGIVAPNIKILPDDMVSYALISLINLYTILIVCMVTYFYKIKWWWKSIPTAALYGAIFLADKINLFHIKEGWFLLFATLDIFGMYFYIFVLDWLIPKTDKWNRKI